MRTRTGRPVRNGTTSLFAASGTGGGAVIAQPYRQHRHQEPIRDRRRRAQNLDLHLVLDNYGTHKTPEVQKWLLRHPWFQLCTSPRPSGDGR